MTKEIPGVFYNDPEMTRSDLDQIEILKEGGSSELWSSYISYRNRHYMLLEDDEWPSLIVAKNQSWYNWTDDWNNDDLGSFKSKLLNLNILPSSNIYVLWMKEVGIKTKWGVFCNNWVNFLYEDEGCILVSPDSDTAVILSNGRSWKGQRSAVKT